jgi:hypothetical protein
VLKPAPVTLTGYFLAISGVINSKHASELRQTAALLMRGEVDDEGKGRSV